MKSTGQLYQWPSGQRILTLSTGPLDDSTVYLSCTSAGSPHLTAPWSSWYSGQSRNITLLAIAMPRSAVTCAGYGLASNTMLKGVSLTRRKRVMPAAVTTSRILASPAWAPRASPTSCDSDAGVHSRVEKP